MRLMQSTLLLVGLVRIAAADAPSGYQCSPGTPKRGVGCTCPTNHADRRIDENIAACLPIPKPSEAAIIKAECKQAFEGIDRAFGLALAGDERKLFRAAFGDLVLKRCEINPWPRPARKCLASAATEEAAYECIDKLPPVQRGGLDADSARIHPVAVQLTKSELRLKGALVFAQTTPTISDTSTSLLAAIAQTLHVHPALRIEIQAHTDNNPEVAKLSQRRAELVKQYLVGNGVAADRLVAKGYGDTLPAASNSTAWGRARNRRVQLMITGGAPRPIAKADRDRDAIDDKDDRCPDEAESWNGTDDEDGCPESKRVIASTTKLEILVRIPYAPNSADLGPDASTTLDGIVAILEAHRGLHLRIVGHTDSTEKAGTKLAAARASGVRAYLIEKGIFNGRLELASPGRDRPRGSNSTADGRAENRRVEFEVVE